MKLVKLYALRITRGGVHFYMTGLRAGPRRRQVTGVDFEINKNRARGWTSRKELDQFRKKYSFIKARVVLIEVER